MYLKFFGFNEAPFNLTPDSKFLFLSHRHQEALAALMFGVQERKGFICLTGDIGCGKTTLCRALLNQLDPDQFKVCVVLNSYLTDVELLKTINEGFGLPAESDSKKELLDALNDYLVREFSLGHNVVLVIDEAQNLPPETLEQIRMISNLETESAKLIQIVLVGQPQLRQTLALPEMEQLNQRITVRYHIMPLDEDELRDYIAHRLSVAEPQVEIEFVTKSFPLIYHFSQGVPRRVNVICDRCLLMAYNQGQFRIDDTVVNKAVAEVRGEQQVYGGAAAPTGASAAAGGRSLWFGRLVGLAALVALIVGGVALTPWLRTRLAAPEPTRTAAASPLDHPAVQPIATPEATPIPTTTPEPTPTPEIPQDPNWQWDGDDVLHVESPALAEVAAYLIALRLWGITVNLDTFRIASEADVARFDMLSMIVPLNFRAYATQTMSEAVRLNLPILIEMEEADDARAPFAVVRAIRNDQGVRRYIVLDPIDGRYEVASDALDGAVRRALVLYPDPNDFTGLQWGHQTQSVRILQTWLAEEKLYDGPIDGIFGPKTRKGIVALQKREALKATGRVDAATAAAIAIQFSAIQPRLTP